MIKAEILGWDAHLSKEVFYTVALYYSPLWVESGTEL